MDSVSCWATVGPFLCLRCQLAIPALNLQPEWLHARNGATRKLITHGLLLQLRQPNQQHPMGNCTSCQWVAICAQAAHGRNQCLLTGSPDFTHGQRANWSLVMLQQTMGNQFPCKIMEIKILGTQGSKRSFWRRTKYQVKAVSMSQESFNRYNCTVYNLPRFACSQQRAEPRPAHWRRQTSSCCALQPAHSWFLSSVGLSISDCLQKEIQIQAKETPKMQK